MRIGAQPSQTIEVEARARNIAHHAQLEDMRARSKVVSHCQTTRGNRAQETHIHTHTHTEAIKNRTYVARCQHVIVIRSQNTMNCARWKRGPNHTDSGALQKKKEKKTSQRAKERTRSCTTLWDSHTGYDAETASMARLILHKVLFIGNADAHHTFPNVMLQSLYEMKTNHDQDTENTLPEKETCANVKERLSQLSTNTRCQNTARECAI